MGKAGKARKKQRLNNEILHHEETNKSEQSDEDIDVMKSILIAIKVLEVLSQRLNVYSSKAHKNLRVALFPLIQRQFNKHFEMEDVLLISEETFISTISATNLGITSSYVIFLHH